MTFTPEFTVDKVRAQFNALHQTHNDLPVTFFDGPGGSQVPESVLEAMVSYLGHYNSNLGASYFSSQLTTQLVTDARNACQALLNAQSADSIIFGANMTSLTFALSRAISRDWQAGDEIVVTALDHYANVSSWQQAAEDKSALVHQAPIIPNDGSLDVEALLNLINSNTRLVALTLASNTTGSIVEVAPVIEAAKRVGAQVYIDAVHYAPHHLIDVQALGCDFLVCSAYKFFGPHFGIGYVAPKWVQTLRPYKVEPAPELGPARFETGTQSFEALAGLVATIEYLAQWGTQGEDLRTRLVESYAYYNQYETALSEYFLAKLKLLKGVRLLGRLDADCAVRTATFALTFDRISTKEVASALGQLNLCVGSGHFYALGLVRQLGIEADGVLRVGLMHYNTKQEIDRLFIALQRLLHL
ncbi:cysteine desulfurase-like protein [Vibrio panuliri]|uniref:Cysteine desulfurase-like protein n=1 Tax=Vibrio panuliri TaxID=1381081 RepID=A0ABX3FTU8_9VIBR|nr:cysteine desulfurase-like protein [Vibrio panuliri]KAB1454183.1 cysteine desulfurase-like protein [Vibrio panuliri]OLQ96211.1 cysteine desulfurase-like protein [Vibrio panuliri]